MKTIESSTILQLIKDTEAGKIPWKNLGGNLITAEVNGLKIALRGAYHVTTTPKLVEGLIDDHNSLYFIFPGNKEELETAVRVTNQSLVDSLARAVRTRLSQQIPPFNSHA